MSGNYYFLTNQLSDDETRVVTSIVNHIENDEAKVGIAQIADENFVSTSFIIKMCKRLGFNGYSELFYSLSRRLHDEGEKQDASELSTIIDNYDPQNVKKFCDFLGMYRERKMFVIGAGFADLVAGYIVQRLGVCGFMVFNRVPFYDYMLFREKNEKAMQSNVDPSLIIAISQSGESEVVLNDVMRAKQRGFGVVAFTKREESTLSGMADITFVVDAARQTLISDVPNHFFGKVILAFEELIGEYFK